MFLTFKNHLMVKSLDEFKSKNEIYKVSQDV